MEEMALFLYGKRNSGPLKESLMLVVHLAYLYALVKMDSFYVQDFWMEVLRFGILNKV